MLLTSVTVRSLYEQLGFVDSPLIVDIRSEQAFLSLPRLIPGAIRGDPNQVGAWARSLSRSRPITVYSSRGREIDPTVASALDDLGVPVYSVDGGLDAWCEAQYATTKARLEFNVPGGSRWITRERPKIDRLACPWLVKRFIDPDATFFYTPAQRVRADAETLCAQPYDIADVSFSHRGSRCSFDAFLEEFDLRDPALDRLAEIVRAADTGELGESREAPGLLAISLGLSATIADDLFLLDHAMMLYDALYAWCKKARDETHSWPQKGIRQSAAENN